MQEWFDAAKKFEALVLEAATAAGLEMDAFAAEIRSADPRFGDLQANGALPYAKARKANPRQIAQAIADQLAANAALSSIAEITIAGPGFINLKFKPAFQLAWLKAFAGAEAIKAAAGQLQAGEKVVVDYGSPNTAKQMHVGHIRSIVVGEAICRLLEFCGAEVVRDNHIGDWGTPYGKLFYAYKRHLDPEALAADPLEELERLYKLGNELANDEAVLNECRQELVDLQNGNPESIALWTKVNELSIQGLDAVYQQLDVKYDYYLGESFYRDKVDQVYRELAETGLSSESQGALVVFHPEHPRFAEAPFIVRKSDGASNYASTDLATMLYRLEHFKATAIIVVTDFRQKDHFEQLELTTRKWFERTGRTMPRFSHVTFGSINGEDGRPIKTRSGDPIRLRQLLAEAIERAAAIVREKNASLPEDELQRIAEVVGVSAIKYADLSQNRSSDYVFAWDKLLAFEGNTAPYLLYAAARIQSIFRKLSVPDSEDAASPFETAEEQALATKIISFVGVLKLTIETQRPHLLCTYLFELAGSFSAFYNNNKVIVEQADVQQRRLLLCRRTLLVLQTGLHLLGIPTLPRM